jgi:periplasmic divalent cation tolerance protein
MKPASGCRIVLVTVPDLKTARRIAGLALEERLTACANLLPALESHYWWKGKLEQGAEVLMLFKTTARNLVALEKLVLKNHPYDTAEFVALVPDEVTQRYLNWWSHEVRRGPGVNLAKTKKASR